MEIRRHSQLQSIKFNLELPDWSAYTQSMEIQGMISERKTLVKQLTDRLEGLSLSQQELPENLNDELKRMKSITDPSSEDQDYLNELQCAFEYLVSIQIVDINMATSILDNLLVKFHNLTNTGLTMYTIENVAGQFISDQSMIAHLSLVHSTFNYILSQYHTLQSTVSKVEGYEMPISRIQMRSTHIKCEFEIAQIQQEINFSQDRLLQFMTNRSLDYVEDQYIEQGKRLLHLQQEIEDLYIVNIEVKETVYNPLASKLLEAMLLDSLVKDMPDCAEKHLFKLLFLISYKICPQDEIEKLEIGVLQEQEVDLLIQSHLKLLKEHAIVENILAKEDLDALCSLEYRSRITLESLKTSLELLKAKLIAFNIKEFGDLYKKSVEAAQQVKGQDIILLLGSTGTGKSTTIHYLAASKMVKKLVNGLPHIDFTHVKNQHLLTVKLSPFSKSETRLVNPIPVKLSDHGVASSKHIIILDTPGSEDTASHEVDLSNGLGIIHAICQTNSVIPVVMYSDKNIGSRGQSLKENIKYYARMLRNPQEDISFFHYIISHAPEGMAKNEEIEYYKSKLLDIEVHLNEAEKYDDTFMKLLQDIITKLQNNETPQEHRGRNNQTVKILRPLDGQALKYLNLLMSSSPIKNPSNAFQLSLTMASLSKVKDQLTLHCTAIINALQAEHLHLAIHKYQEMVHFLTCLPDQEGLESYIKDCNANAIQLIHNNYKNAEVCLKKWFSLSFLENLASEDNGPIEFFMDFKLLKQFKKHLKFAENIEGFRRTCLNNEDFLSVNSYEDVVTLVKSITSQKINKLLNKDFSNAQWKILFKKATETQAFFTELNEAQGLVKQVLESFRKKLDLILKECIEKIDIINLPESERQQVQQMDQIEQIQEIQDIDDIFDQQQLLMIAPQETPPVINNQNDKIKQFIKLMSKVRTMIELNIENTTANECLNKTYLLLNQKLEQRISILKNYQLSFIQWEQYQKHAILNQSIEKPVSNSIIFDNNVTKAKDQLSNIDKYQELLQTIFSYLKDTQLNETINIVSKQIMEIQDILLLYFKVQIDQINKDILDEKQNFKIQKQFENLEFLQYLPFLKKTTQPQFDMLKTNLFSFVQQQADIIKQIINSDLQNNKISQKNIKKLKLAVRALDNLQWISQQSSNAFFFSSIQQTIRGQLDDVLDDIKLESRMYSLDIKCDEDSFEKIYSSLNSITDIYDIGEILKLQLEIVESQDVWKRQILMALDNIKNTIKDLDEASKGGSQVVINRGNAGSVSDKLKYLTILQKFQKLLEMFKIGVDTNELFCSYIQFIQQQKSLIFTHINNTIENIRKTSSQVLEGEQIILSQSRIDQEVSQSVNQLRSLEDNIKLINTIQQHYPQLWQYFDQGEQLNLTMREDTKILISDIDSDLKRHHANNMGLFIITMSVLKSLRVLDPLVFPQDSLIEQVYKSWQERNTGTQAIQLKNFERDLEQKRFQQINQNLTELQAIDTAEACSIFRENKDSLNRRSEKLHRDLRALINSIDDETLTAIQCTEINQMAHELLLMRKYINQAFLQSWKDIQGSLEFAVEEIIKNLKVGVQKINDTIKIMAFNNTNNIIKATRIIVKQITFLDEISKADEEREALSFMKELKDNFIQEKEQFKRAEENASCAIENLTMKFEKISTIEELLPLIPDQIVQKQRPA